MQFEATRSAGLHRLEQFAGNAGRFYAAQRNHDTGPGRSNVSQLSPWLHAGLVSEQEVLETVLAQHTLGASEKFVSEVFWRIYFKGYLEQRPSIWDAFTEGRSAAFGRLETDPAATTAYTAAVEGQTGIPAFDYWARELVETGYLHNHARMWFASIWMFTLELDWELGADFFLRHLMDGDAASNTLSWRWVAGLHTKGRTYLARQANITRYTADHPEGPLKAPNLAAQATALEDKRTHERNALALPDSPELGEDAGPVALVLHDEAASHAPLDLPVRPDFVLGVCAPQDRSPKPVGGAAHLFAQEAINGGVAEAGAHFECGTGIVSDAAALSGVLEKHGIRAAVIPYLPAGWTRDSVQPALDRFCASGGAVHSLVSPLDRAAWPHAKAGFFGLKKAMESAMREAGVAGA